MPRKMNLMTAPPRLTVKYNIYHDDSDVPTRDSPGDGNRKYLLTNPSRRNCELDGLHEKKVNHRGGQRWTVLGRARLSWDREARYRCLYLFSV